MHNLQSQELSGVRSRVTVGALGFEAFVVEMHLRTNVAFEGGGGLSPLVHAVDGFLLGLQHGGWGRVGSDWNSRMQSIRSEGQQRLPR